MSIKPADTDRLEDAVWGAYENGATREEIEQEVEVALLSIEEEDE